MARAVAMTSATRPASWNGITVVLLEAEQARLLADDDVPRTLPWSASMPDALMQAVRQSAPETRAVVLVIGGAWLECARPQLPPVAPALQRRALHFQADRFFATPGVLATTMLGDVAVAADATWIAVVRAPFEAWVPVLAVTSLPQAALFAGERGEWHTTAGRGEYLALTIGAMSAGVSPTLADVRRARGVAPATARPLELAPVLRAAQHYSIRRWPSDAQLLDVASEEGLARAAQQAWVRASVIAVGALVALAWGVEQWRGRELTETQAMVTRLTRQATPALEAESRLRRAAEEAAVIRAATVHAARSDAPSQVLARLGALLPPGAFVQRFEWDGTQWRIDGSALDAAALVPRLDADPEIEAVRTLAPSSRFLDNGVARSSFSIGFRLRGAPPADGGPRGGS